MTQKGWAITGIYGLYSGWNFTRKDAITTHCCALGRTWAYCRKTGDKCVKIEIKICSKPNKTKTAYLANQRKHDPTPNNKITASNK